MSGINKAAVLYGAQDIRIEDREIPVPGRNEVLIRSMDVSICATEVKYWYYGMPDVVPGTKIVQGHELSGIVEDVCSIEDSHLIGKKVAVDPSLWCGICDMCMARMSNLCRKLQFMSLPPIDGGYQQFYKVPKKNVHLLPEDMPLKFGSMAEPVSIIINAIADAEKLVGSVSGKSIAIMGAGSLGLILMQMLAQKGIQDIYIFEPLDYRRKLANDLGCSTVFDPKAYKPQDIISEITKGIGVDLSFEVAGEPDSYRLASEITKPGGSVIIVGIPSEQNHIPIQVITARRSGLTLRFVRRFNPKDFPLAIDILAAGKVRVSELITHSFSLNDMSMAFNIIHENSDQVVKAVIHPNSDS